MEEIFKLYTSQGETAMNGKELFEQALSGTTPPPGTPGNKQKQVNLMSVILQGLTNQSSGMVQKMRLLTLTKAASVEMQEGYEIIKTIDTYIDDAQKHYQEVSPVYQSAALGDNQAVSQLETSSIQQEVQENSCETEAQTSNVSVEEVSLQQEEPFDITDLRNMIRSHTCLSYAYNMSNPNKNIATDDFEIREKDARSLYNTLLAKKKQGKLAEIKKGYRALKFLQEEYNLL